MNGTAVFWVVVLNAAVFSIAYFCESVRAAEAWHRSNPGRYGENGGKVEWNRVAIMQFVFIASSILSVWYWRGV